MAKEFKEWDKKFSASQIRAERDRWGAKIRQIHITRDRWDMIVDSWVQSFVQQCVYHEADVANWQLFRVSLKGLETWEKLTRLKVWYHEYCFLRSTETEEQLRQWKVNKCRIDNYIGALVRGGQLSTLDYKVLK